MAPVGQKSSVHKYECSNWHNEYSSQRYPLHIIDVTFTDIISKKTPDGMLYVSVKDVAGYCSSLLKCYKNAKGERYCIFGKHRLYEGYSGPVMLIGVPESNRSTLLSCGCILAD